MAGGLVRARRAGCGQNRSGRLDLYTSEQARHVGRLVTLGTTRVREWPYPDGADFIVMRDLDGNEFYVIDHPEL